MIYEHRAADVPQNEWNSTNGRCHSANEWIRVFSLTLSHCRSLWSSPPFSFQEAWAMTSCPLKLDIHLTFHSIHVRFLHACTQSLISYASSCWQGCWHCCLRVLDCLSLPRNLMPLPYHVGSLNDIHFQRQCQHQRYILASWRHAALHCFDWSWLPLCWAAFLIFPIRSLCWEIWYVFSVTGTVEERR